MMLKHIALLCILPIFLSAIAYAQTPAASPEATMWDHNGSVMYLVANGSSREFYYQKPRPGMLEAGAHHGSPLFRGQVNNGQYSGTAYVFNPRCGQIPFQVKGGILDNDERILLTGQAPRLGRNCRAYASYASNLEFRLLKSIAEHLSPEPQGSNNEETKPEISLTGGDTLSTSTAQSSTTHPSPSPANDVSGNTARRPPSSPTPLSSSKNTFGADYLDNYVLTAAYVVLIGALLFFSASQFSKRFWRKRGYFY